MNNRIAMFPGSFDPLTNGHLDIIKRASVLFDKVYVVVSVNPKKNTLFTAEERKEIIENNISRLSNVEVVIWKRLSVDMAKKYNAGVIIRGLRTAREFEDEYEMSLINKKLYFDLETLFIPSKPELFSISSSAVKEIASFGGDVSNMVPQDVVSKLQNKFNC